MKRLAFLLLIPAFLIAGKSYPQMYDPSVPATSNGQSPAAPNRNEPQINYEVNKEYDENGNLIRYDSVYTYYYSNIDTVLMMQDSVFSDFNRFFQRQDLFEQSFFDDFFRQDFYPENDFYSPDFFMQSFEKEQEMFFQLMKRMDSIKNRFFMEYYPLPPQE